MTERKFKRIKITALSKINHAGCSVINISKEGMMLYGNLNSNDQSCDIQLKISGKWLDLKGKIIWTLDGPKPNLKHIGIYIIDAPTEYQEFIDNLYLEVDEKS
ncbi:MAG: PilZ domain-containing protein [Candidatus Omnitrophota bacterium]